MPQVGFEPMIPVFERAKIVHALDRAATVIGKGKKKKKVKALPVTGRGDPQVYERSKLSHYLDNLLADGSEVVILTRRPPFTPRKIPRTLFC
jgi:hypothetical protein